MAKLRSHSEQTFVLGSYPHAGAIPLGGDAAALDFGLSGKDYLSLTAQIDRLVVAEAPDRGRLESPTGARHVRAAQEALEFVRSGGGRAQVVFLSSLLIFGAATTRVSEADFRVDQGFANAFEESLALAEQTVRLAGKLNVPLSIARVAPLVGNTETGLLDRASPLLELVELIRSGGIHTDAIWTDRPIHFETHNHLATALASLVEHGGQRTVHLVRPAPPTDRELCEWLEETFGKTKTPNERIGSLIRRPALLALRSPERRAFTGWALGFGSTEAQALGLNQYEPWPETLRKVLARSLTGTDRAEPDHA